MTAGSSMLRNSPCRARACGSAHSGFFACAGRIARLSLMGIAGNERMENVGRLEMENNTDQIVHSADF